MSRRIRSLASPLLLALALPSCAPPPQPAPCNTGRAGFDVNGDGFADIVVGAASDAPVTVYSGSRTGLTTTPAAMLTGPTDGMFSSAVAKAGDVNGDGFSDLAVLYTDYTDATHRSVQVFLGSATGVSTTAAATFTAPAGKTIYAVNCLGDVNKDGFTDLGVGVVAPSTGAGQLLVYLGSRMGLASTPAVTVDAPAGSNFGGVIASVGDVNGDGYGDFGAFSQSNSASVGEARVFLGGEHGPATTAATTLLLPAGLLGGSFASAGDVNKDGFDDVVVSGLDQHANAGHAFVYLGSMTGLSSTVATELVGPAEVTRFGQWAAGVGDVNGDGFGDVVVASQDEAQAFLYLGSEMGLSATPATQLSSASAMHLGWSLAAAGDVNGDGFADLVVGEIGTLMSASQVFVFQGSAHGFAANPAATITEETGNLRGSSVASLGKRAAFARG